MTPLRIVLCNGEYPPFAGGGGVYTYLLAKGLAEAWPEAQIIVYAGTPEQSFDGKLLRQSTNLLVYYSRKLWDLDYGGSPFLDVIQDFEEIIKLFRPQLIYAHHTMESLLAGMVADKHGIPFILTIQKSPVPDPVNLEKPSWTAVKFCYQRMPYHGVIATSDIYASQALQLGARQPLRRIYYGIDRKQFRLSPDKRTQTRTALGLSDNEVWSFVPPE